MKQFQVPQFIDVEDRILGFVTMRQFFIMLIPVGAGILSYFIFNLWLAIIVLVPVTAVSAIFAFVKPNGMKFSRFLSSFLAYTFKPRLYVWKQENDTQSVNIEDMIKEESEKHKESKGLKNKKGELETGSKITQEDIDKIGGESEYLDEIMNQ